MSTSIATLRARRGGRAFFTLSWLAPPATVAVLVGMSLLVMNDLPPGTGSQGWPMAHVLAPWVAVILAAMLVLTVLVAVAWTVLGSARIVRGFTANGGRSETLTGLVMFAVGLVGLAFAFVVLRVALATLFGIT